MATEVGKWLLALDMDEHVDAFEDNQIALEDLPELTDGDLKELGVSAMGHRKSIIRAAAANAVQQSDISDSTVEPAISSRDSAKITSDTKPQIHSGSAERRQLTVMFADLVGSTELASSLDPEDLREAITLYQECVTRPVKAMEGHIFQYLGDGVMCFFGWPQAHEDDAERAARAALDVISNLEFATAPNGQKLQARIGIATGLVVVGDVIGEGVAQDEAVVGETPNLAARLQNIAETGQIVVSDTTRNLLSQSLNVKHIGKQDLKGIARPVDAYAILGENEAVKLADANHSAGSTPLIGREAEISLLMDRWGQSVDGEGQVFILSGEPGIGKSQISATLVNKIDGQAHKTLQFQCSPYFASTAFHPAINFLERAAEFARGDDETTKLGKLVALLKTVFDDFTSVAAFFAAMLSLPVDRYPAIGLEPLKQREQTIAAFVDFIASLSAQSPLLILFEDTHWCDATSVEMLTALIQRIDDLPVLLIVTHRPEFQSPWQNIGHVTQYNLNRLPRRHSTSIINGLTGGKKLPDLIVEQILAKTDGVPLFVEELTRTVLDAGFLLEKEGAYILDGPLPPFAIPSSLQDSLMARLDRLSPLKDVAQTAACIGREFTFELLSCVSPLTSRDLQKSLEDLVFNELIVARGTPPESIYTFKHALVQDAAYNSLLRSRRQQVHANIAKVLVEQFSTQIELQPELAAQHLTAAGLGEEAVPHWLSAGLVAISKSANEEAINHLANGLNCLLALPESAERDEQELLLRAMLGVAQFTARGYASLELGENYENALSLAKRVGDTPYKSPAMFGVWAYHLMRVNHAKATEVYIEAIDQAKETGIAHEMTAALAAATTASIFKGQTQLGIEFSEASWRAYDKATHGDLVALFGQDVGLWCADFGSWAVWLDGRSDEADRRYGEANRLAEELGHPLSLASGLVHASLLYSMAGDVERTLEYADKTIIVCEEVGIPARLVEAFIMKGWALSENGQIDEGIALTQQGMDGWRGAGAEIARPWWLALQSHQFQRRGDHTKALAVLDEALSTVEQSGENLWLPELKRLRGQLMLDIDASQTKVAEEQFRSAMLMAKQQVSKFWELRAATSLGILMNERAEGQQALDMLRPLYSGIIEGGETMDMRSARQLISTLGG